MSRITSNPKTARLSVSLDEQTYETLCAIAREDDVSVAWVIRRAVGDLVRSRAPANDITQSFSQKSSVRRKQTMGRAKR